jgi:hypothetical protein
MFPYIKELLKFKRRTKFWTLQFTVSWRNERRSMKPSSTVDKKKWPEGKNNYHN